MKYNKPLLVIGARRGQRTAREGLAAVIYYIKGNSDKSKSNFPNER